MVRNSLSCDLIGSSVIGRGAYLIESRRKIYAFTESQGLKRDKALVMIGRRNGIKLFVIIRPKKAIGGIWTKDQMPPFGHFPDNRLQNLIIFLSDNPVIPTMRIYPQKGYFGFPYSKIHFQGLFNNGDLTAYQSRGNGGGHVLYGDMVR